MDYSLQCKEKMLDRDLIYSIYTSALAIKWPNGDEPKYADLLQTNVNLFRVLFSYLSDDQTYLNHLQEDSSYTVIEEGAPFGVYEYINPKGQTVFIKKE